MPAHPPSLPGCTVAGCTEQVGRGAPLELCEHHLAIAAEWAGRQFGVSDVLPSPCRLCGSRLGVRYPSGWLCAVCEWRHSDLIDGELPRPRVDVVYYIRYDDRVKIGTSSNPRSRLSALWHDDLLAFERGDRSLEHRRHEQFADERFDRTEWFALSERLRNHIELVRAGGDDPWDRYRRWVSEAVALRG
ncbi:hypothetical protein SAMN04487846_1728 [Microbacterium sp. cf046]|uniref:GIY-YIG nuclease family protein n=1 Tax=Microbacterium sp. cf046 TaxID=1761803 RepID=UPI0008F41A46|nr:GIY-YIG nuclease family protein [Microbacterium sp. cf046]SFS03949.1 hypothetical protein SAMN04487846_1728 [Microbacterium sp. cf046]